MDLVDHEAEGVGRIRGLLVVNRSQAAAADPAGGGHFSEAVAVFAAKRAVCGSWIISHDKRKKPERQTDRSGLVWARASGALASVDVNQDLVRALPAVDRQRPRLGPQIDALGLAITAERADQKAVLYCQEHITFAPELQEFSTPFPKNNTVIKAERK